MIKRDAIRDSLSVFGMYPASLDRTTSVLVAIQIDPALRHHQSRIELALADFIYNAHSFLKGGTSMDDAINGLRSIQELLKSLESSYKVVALLDQSRDLSSALQRARGELDRCFEWM